MPYVELHCHSAYSFLDGASHPEELALRAAELGYGAVALTDHEGVYGSLEFAHAAKLMGVRAITGAEVTLAGGTHVTLLVERAAAMRASAASSRRHTRTRGQGRCRAAAARARPSLLAELSEGLVCLSGCARDGLGVRDPNAASGSSRAFGPDRFFVELQRPFERGDVAPERAPARPRRDAGMKTVVTGNVHAHHQRRTALQDVLVAIRQHASLESCERERRGNRESIMRAPAEMLELFPDDRDAVRGRPSSPGGSSST